MERIELEKLVRSAVTGERTVESVVETLLQELGRGGRILVVDENVYDLVTELVDIGYTVKAVGRGKKDEDIKKMLDSRIIITKNGADFCDPKDMADFRYGLIWVVGNPDIQVLAKRVEAAIVANNFRRNLIQVVKV